MEAHPRKLKAVFRSDVRLTVPLFQRSYVWNASEQWQPLWDDVVATLERVHHGDAVPHFLGAIVLEQKRASLGNLETREVIDGQQRLTTLQLLTAAIRDAYISHGIDNKVYKRLAKLLHNDEDLVDGPDEVHKLWPTNRDREPYRKVMAGHYRDATTNEVMPRIAAGYVWFRDAIDDFVGGRCEDDVEQLLDQLAVVVLEHLEVVVIDLGEDDNAQVIFETLNARGTALRASDLIKNFVFRTLQDAGRDVEKLYTSTWEALEAEQWQKDVRLGRLTRPRLDTFMGFFLILLLQREVQSHQLFTESRRHIAGDPDRAEHFLQELARYARTYDSLETGHSLGPEEASILGRLEIADTQTVTPLLLWLFGNTHGAVRTRALATLESYLVRRTLTRLTTKNYNRLFLELLRRVAADPRPADVVIETYLATQSSESGMWPSDAEMIRSMRSLPLYRLLKRDRLQRVLLALEAHLTTSRTEPLAPNRKLSVEHLMPQAWTQNWPLPGDPDQAAALQQHRDALLHTLGNLTLVTGTLNASMSNAAWPTKRHHLLANSALTLNRTLPEVWGTPEIETRSTHLAEAAVALWKRPLMPDDAPLYAADAERDLRPDRDAELSARKQATTTRESGSTGGRRDIGQHITHVFESVPSGTFITIAGIRNTPSPQYQDSPPSAGAISARLFPARGGETTVPGVAGVIRNGLRGALKQ